MHSYYIADRTRRTLYNFRILMKALSHPGRKFQLEARSLFYDFPAQAAAECLMDHEVGFSVTGWIAGDTFPKAIETTTGARPVPLNEADFIFVNGPTSHGQVRHAKRGTPEYPDGGATLFYCLDTAGADVAERFLVRFSGPGIAEAGGIAPEMHGLALTEFDALRRINDDYPLGVDVFLIGESGGVMGLPRSTRIKVG